MGTTSRLRGLLRQVLHLDESPHRTALAFATGVFLTFSPPYGLHMVLALFCAWAFRMNLAALVAGLCVNTPWTLVPTLGLTLWFGCVLLDVPFPTTLDWSDTSAAGIFLQVAPYLGPFVAGATLISLLGALVAYPIAFWLVTRYRTSRPAPTSPLPLPPESEIR